MTSINVAEQADGTFVVTRGRRYVGRQPTRPAVRILVAECFEPGDTVKMIEADGLITNITREVMRSLTRNRSRTRRVRGRN